MQQRIAFDPQIGISVDEFVKNWNNSAKGAEAPATASKDTKETFLPPEVTTVLIAAAVGIPAAVIANFISECLKKKFIEKDPPRLTTTTIQTPDGEPIIIIKRLEE